MARARGSSFETPAAQALQDESELIATNTTAHPEEAAFAAVSKDGHVLGLPA
jgi:hypothetical protein